MDVSIIIVNYNTASLCKDVVLSIREKTHNCDYEIIIVDNSNNEKEFQALKEIEGIKAIDAKGNVGFGAGNNLGAKEATGRYFFFLNSDTILVNDAISTLVEFLDSNDEVGIVGPNLYTKELKPTISYELKEKNLHNDAKGILASLLRKVFSKNYFHNHKNIPLEIKGYVSGAALMIRKELFDSVGGFDSRIFMYAEESLLCYKAVHEHFSLICNVPFAKIIHLEGGSFDKVSDKKFSFFVDGNYMYYSIAFDKKTATNYLIKLKKRLMQRLIIAKIFKKREMANDIHSHIEILEQKIEVVRK